MHDVHQLLNSYETGEYYFNLSVIRRVGPVLLREGLRHIYSDSFKHDVQLMANSYFVLRKIAQVD